MGAESDEPRVDPVDGSITFTVVAEDGVEPLAVWFHLRHFGADPSFAPTGTGRWSATIPAPPVDRLEYLFSVRAADGTESLVVDPANPERVPGAFGDKSVVELAGYRAPAWLTTTSPAWTSKPVLAETDVEGVEVRGELLTPPGASDSDVLPLLVVHDGPEYSRLARLGDYLTWLSSWRPEVACRALLLQPSDRDLSYAASPAYTEALVEQALVQARELAPTAGRPVGMGASLGALALGHAATTYPDAFAGLFLQSGSFFLPRFDAHERRFRYYDRVVAAVAAIYADPAALTGMPVTITAGLGEENLDNNRALAEHLAARGGDVRLHEGRDGHNYCAWRDLLDPALGDLLAHVWAAGAHDRRDDA